MIIRKYELVLSILLNIRFIYKIYELTLNLSCIHIKTIENNYDLTLNIPTVHIKIMEVTIEYYPSVYLSII